MRGSSCRCAAGNFAKEVHKANKIVSILIPTFIYLKHMLMTFIASILSDAVQSV